MVASMVVLPPAPPVTRLPWVTRRSPMRPVIGALSSVNSRSSAAWRTIASLAATAAWALRNAWARCSKICSLMVRSRNSCCPRARSDWVKTTFDLAVAEVDLIEVARYARAYLDDVHGDEAADIFVLVHDGALRGLGDRHLRWRQRRLLLAFAAA